MSPQNSWYPSIFNMRHQYEPRKWLNYFSWELDVFTSRNRNGYFSCKNINNTPKNSSRRAGTHDFIHLLNFKTWFTRSFTRGVQQIFGDQLLKTMWCNNVFQVHVLLFLLIFSQGYKKCSLLEICYQFEDWSIWI